MRLASCDVTSLAMLATMPRMLHACCADDRLVTHWLRVIGKHAPGAPLVDIELTQRADVLVSAKAKVRVMASDTVAT